MTNLSSTTSPSSVPAPSDDKRWHIIDATMRRYGYASSALIETLRSIQDNFGCLDQASLIYTAYCLKVPLSKVYGVATFYSLFRLKPLGAHTGVVCMGTACYVKGGSKLLAAAERCTGIRALETTLDNKISLMTEPCIGACGLAPAAIFDGQVFGYLTPAKMEAQIKVLLTIAKNAKGPS